MRVLVGCRAACFHATKSWVSMFRLVKTCLPVRLSRAVKAWHPAVNLTRLLRHSPPRFCAEEGDCQRVCC